MAMEAAEIERLIKESLPDAEVTIDDLRGDGDHYSARVVSAAFAGKTRVQQHQLIPSPAGPHGQRTARAAIANQRTGKRLKSQKT